MTDKRFKTNEVGCIVDLKDKHLRNYDGEEIVDLLNKLAKENEQLRQLLEYGLEVSQGDIDYELKRMNGECLE